METGNTVWHLTVLAVPEQFPTLREWLENRMAGLAVPLKAQQQILIAADELFSNIAAYAYQGKTGEAEMTLTWDKPAEMLNLTFSDQGRPFDPLQQPEPDVTRPAEERTIGGLGILVVRKMMDQVEYRREGPWNRLTVRKRIGEGAR